MSYTIVIAPRVKKQIAKLPVHILTKISNAIREIAENPFQGKPLKAQLAGLYSFRAGQYRIIYNIVRHEIRVEIIKIMHRKDVYR